MYDPELSPNLENIFPFYCKKCLVTIGKILIRPIDKIIEFCLFLVPDTIIVLGPYKRIFSHK